MTADNADNAVDAALPRGLLGGLPTAGVPQVTNGGPYTITALAAANTIAAGAGRNLILAQGGNDLIASTGDDLIGTPDGNPKITAGTNAPVIFVDSGASTLLGAANGRSTVAGGAETLNLSDGTRILFCGLTNLTSADFLSRLGFFATRRRPMVGLAPRAEAHT